MKKDDGMTEQLPGFGQPATHKNAMQLAAEKKIQKLRDEDVINDSHALEVQLILELAKAIGKSAERGQAAAMAQASRELREALDALPKQSNDAFAALTAEMTE